MSDEQLDDLTQPQRDRLAFVELRVRFIGDIRRQDLVSRFGIQSAAATRDLAIYKELAPGNIDYDTKAKCYVLGEDFKPLFDFPPERVLSWLTQGFGDGEPSQLKAWVDRLAVAGKTFRYTENGPEGLAAGKKLIIASSRGGFFGPETSAAALDHQETYLRALFGFLGITDIAFVRAEGVAMGPEAREKAFETARDAVNKHAG